MILGPIKASREKVLQIQGRRPRICNHFGIHFSWPHYSEKIQITVKGQDFLFMWKMKSGILLSQLFLSTVRKNCSNDQEKLLKFETEGREFAKFLRSLEQLIQTVKCQKNFW